MTEYITERYSGQDDALTALYGPTPKRTINHSYEVVCSECGWCGVWMATYDHEGGGRCPKCDSYEMEEVGA